jgi:cell division protein FtsA
MAPALSKKIKLSNGRAPIVAAIDIGSTKITCLIAQVKDSGDGAAPEIRVLGIGHQEARGVRAGVITDMEAAEVAVRDCVGQAEQMAGTTILTAKVNISSASLRSRVITEQVDLINGEVTENDVRRVLRDAHARAHGGGFQTLHTIPIGFCVDGSRGIRDPRNMLGEQLAVRLNEVSVDPGPLRNIGVCVERCHIAPEGPVFSAYASALGALVDDEMELGVSVIECGGGTTSIASFFEGRLIFAKTFAVGGMHVTQDIARGLSTPLAHAERMKTLYGSTMASPHDDREMIDVPPIGEEYHRSANHVPRSMLVGIIKPRIEETFEFVRDALAASGVERVAGHRIVLTGGGSQLNGLREYAGRYFDAHVRIGRPRGIAGLPEAVSNPAFATAGGLLTYDFRAPEEAVQPAPSRVAALLGMFGFGRRIEGRRAA